MAAKSVRGTENSSPGRAFPATRHSVIRRASSKDPEERTQAYETLITAYWKPVYKYLRIRWRAGGEDARDLTQAFFTRVMEKDFFQSFDPAKARFRTFLRTCLDAFVSNERRSAGRLKRGGDTVLLSLDFETADGELRHHEPAANVDLDELFYKEWIRHVFGLAVGELRDRLKASGKDVHFALFERLDLESAESDPKPTYDELASRFELSISQVTNYLAAARREFRRVVLETLRDVTASEEEFRAEAQHLLGVQP